jgi:hypothetical protein
MMLRMSIAMRVFALGFVASMCLPLGASAQEKAATANVYFYRYKQFQGSALKPSIYCDGKELLRMQNGRFFEAELPAGDHTCYANDKQAGVAMTFEAGKDYYFQTELQVGFWKGHFRLEMVMPEQGKYDIGKLKPLDNDMVVTKGSVSDSPNSKVSNSSDMP